MLVHRFVMLASSATLRLPRRACVSVTANVPVTGAAWMVVPKASKPEANGKLAEPATAALLVQLVLLNALPAPVFTIFKITEFGRTPVKVLLSTSLLSEREARPFGVMRQEQQETNCSSGENA